MTKNFSGQYMYELDAPGGIDVPRGVWPGSDCMRWIPLVGPDGWVPGEAVQGWWPVDQDGVIAESGWDANPAYRPQEPTEDELVAALERLRSGEATRPEDLAAEERTLVGVLDDAPAERLATVQDQAAAFDAHLREATKNARWRRRPDDRPPSES